MATIGIDCRFAGTGTGLARYATEITKALIRTPGDWTLFVRDRGEGWLREIPAAVRVIEAPYRHYSLGEQLRFPGVLRHSGIDLLFVPHFNAPVVCPVPFVITVHDLILHRYPNDAPPLKRAIYRCVFRSAVRRARRIIAVSRFVEKEIEASFGPEAARKTATITEGVGEEFRPRPASPSSRPYFLYVGNAKEHKNVQLLIDAYEASGVEAELLLVTGGKESKRLLLARGVRVVSHVDDEALATLYSGARAFVTASLYEGFCLPVAEALACGCAVIASNRTAIPETLGSSGLLIEPTVTAFAEAFRKPPAPPEPRRIGSWEEAGRKTAEILREATEY